MDCNIWDLRYEPKNLNEYIGNNHIKEKFKKYIEENNPPHILLYGKPGTGKTTLGNILSNNTDSETLYINGSDETSVEIIRNKVKDFAISVSLEDIKIVFIDEFDRITPHAQDALKYIMDKTKKITRFLFTANTIERVSDAIKSRCQKFEVIPPSMKEVGMRAVEILKKENIKYKLEDVAIFVKKNYPDIRGVINDLQLYSKNSELKINEEELINSDFKLKFLEILKKNEQKNTKFKLLRQHIIDNHISDYSIMYRFLYDNIDDYAKGEIAKTILIIAEGLNNDTFSPDREINFMSTIIKLINELKS